MKWIPESNRMCYEDEEIQVKSLEDNSVLFRGVMHNLWFEFDFSPDNVVSDNAIAIYPYVFHYSKIYPRNILGSHNPEATRCYNHEIGYEDLSVDKIDYSRHMYSFERTNGDVLFHARLKKSNMHSTPAKPPYELMPNERTQAGEFYKNNLYYCPIKQVIAAGQAPITYGVTCDSHEVCYDDEFLGQAPITYGVTCDPEEWYYELERFINYGNFYYPDGRVISIGHEGTHFIEKKSVKLEAWKDNKRIEKRVWYAIETINTVDGYYKDVKITFESDFAKNAIFEFKGTFSRKSKKREDVKLGCIAYFLIDGVVSTKGREGGDIKKSIEIYNKELTGQNFTSIFADSIFLAKNNIGSQANPFGLDDLIGLSKVKETFVEFSCFGEFLKKQKSQVDNKTSKDELLDILTSKNNSNPSTVNDDAVALHMAFLGSPGTGKTTVAERVAAMLKEYGLVVQNEKPIVVVKSDLVGKYIGETEDIVKNKIQEALGGILFIDEAYTLFDGKDSKDFGNIALNEIMYAMEHFREKLVVIFAGYTDEMLNMLKNANPGLASRIPWKFYFEDYSVSEMWDIFYSKVIKGGFKFEDEDSANDLAKKYFDELKTAYDNVEENGSKKYYFGNGRGVRTFFQYMQMGLAVRCCNTEISDKIFSVEDIEYAYSKFMYNTEKLTISKKAAKIGFKQGS